MPDPYPLHAHAASFWIAGDDLMIAFPGQGPQGQGHTIRLPASTAGLAVAISILKDRSRATDLRIAQRGTPTQYDLEVVARYMVRADVVAKREASAAEAAEADAFLKELGL